MARAGETAQATIQALVKHGVSMTSTLAVYEPFVANRPTKEPRVLNAMAPEVRASYMKIRQEIDSTGSGPIAAEGLRSAMTFEREFVEAGGLLAAGVDPTGIGGALAGYGDQRNYELFIEAGFAPEQAVKIMTANGAKTASPGGPVFYPHTLVNTGGEGEAGRPGGPEGRSHRRSDGDPESDRRLQGRDRLRLGQADRVDPGAGGDRLGVRRANPIPRVTLSEQPPRGQPPASPAAEVSP